MIRRTLSVLFCSVALPTLSFAQLTDVTQTPNTANAGIKKSLTQQIGAGRGDVMTPGSSRFIIARDPVRAIMRGRQLFQRKFTIAQGAAPRTNDGVGDIEQDASHGAGLADSCAACHSRPFGSAGFGGNVFTRPDSRDAPHLFGLGLQEMLADEISRELRDIADMASQEAQSSGNPVTKSLQSKGIDYGSITALPDGSFDTTLVEGVNADLRVRPFFAEGSTISIREFLVGAFNAEMGLESPDPDLLLASQGQDVETPSGMWLTGTEDAIEAPPATGPGDDPDGDNVVNEIDPAVVDHLEFYLLNYFKPGVGRTNGATDEGRLIFEAIGCAECHVPDLLVDEDRRVADVETNYSKTRANRFFGFLHAVAATQFDEVDDGSGFPTLKEPKEDPFLVRNIYTDFKRHDLGVAFHERNFDGSVTTEFMTEPLWGVSSTPPYGHDGRSPTLLSVIVRHGGEAEGAREAFLAQGPERQDKVLQFLETLQLFSPPDTASNLDPMNPTHPSYPLAGHGSIDLSVLFNDPNDKE